MPPLALKSASLGGEPAAEASRLRGVDQIIEQLQAGVDREENFQRLFQRYDRLVHRFFRRQGCTSELSEDLTQETFLRIDRALGDFRRETRFETWLFRIAGNVYQQEIRRGMADKRAGEELSLEDPRARVGLLAREEQPPIDSGQVLHQLLAKERLQMLRQALAELPPQMRQCVSLRLTQELRYREIAELLQISVDAVKVQLARARTRLRDKLAEHFDDCRV